MDVSEDLLQLGPSMVDVTRELSEPDAFREELDALSEGVYLVDRRRTIRFWNRAAERISGYRAEDVVGHRCFENILRHVDGTGRRLCVGRCPLADTIRDGERRSCRVWMHHKDGRVLPVRVAVIPIRNAQKRVIGAMELFTDESSPNAAVERAAALKHLALTDQLTRLPNRRYLDTALPAALADARRDEQRLGVAFLAVDRFKAINDAYGHEVGDRVLCTVAGTLAANLLTGDVVCRFGGETFVLLLAGPDPAHVAAICEQLLALVRCAELDLEPPKVVRVTASIGATVAAHNESPDAVLRRADELLYRSKKTGRDRITFDADR